MTQVATIHIGLHLQNIPVLTNNNNATIMFISNAALQQTF